MPWEVRESKLSATSSGGSTTTSGRDVDDSIEAAISRFETEVAPTSIDAVSTRKTGPNRCAVVIIYTA